MPGPHTHRDNALSRIMWAPIAPPVTVCYTENLTTFLFFWKFATSASPDRSFSRVGLVQTDLRGRLLDTTMIDLMWAKQAP